MSYNTTVVQRGFYPSMSLSSANLACLLPCFYLICWLNRRSKYSKAKQDSEEEKHLNPGSLLPLCLSLSWLPSFSLPLSYLVPSVSPFWFHANHHLERTYKGVAENMPVKNNIFPLSVVIVVCAWKTHKHILTKIYTQIHGHMHSHTRLQARKHTLTHAHMHTLTHA